MPSWRPLRSCRIECLQLNHCSALKYCDWIMSTVIKYYNNLLKCIIIMVRRFAPFGREGVPPLRSRRMGTCVAIVERSVSFTSQPSNYSHRITE